MTLRSRTLLDKLWDAHVIEDLGDGRALLHIDCHLLNEGTSPQAFSGLELAGRKLRNPELTFATTDHIVSTDAGRGDDTVPGGREWIEAMRRNAKRHGITHYDINDPHQGIVHVIAPELGMALPGMSFVCGDSHSCTIGALGALAWGIGTSEVEHVLATQALILRRPGTMRVTVNGRLGAGVAAKDLVLHLIGTIGTAGATNFALEYAGPAITALEMEGRMTLCNMGVEAGARIAMVAPDDTTFSYVEGRPLAPKGQEFAAAVATWRTLPSDPGARFDRELSLEAGAIGPQITWGTSPQDVIGIDQRVPDPAAAGDDNRRRAMIQALDYMGLGPGMALEGLPIDKVFIGSCTNSRVSDLQAAAAVVRGRKVAPGVRALVVPGSGPVKREAEALGLDRVFREAGFEWREPGCSMCAGVNADRVGPRERCVATSNRNFEGRQGPLARTHLASPAMAAAAALAGRITDVRKLLD
ncbi:MAG: 3-isopropylmalate dehydratase large subunit [Betaproteobacteria bacterium RIFCSPLOWO2_02_FULL_65_24]|nr:MAG: 3-isopropylmalate dehydratase large subunit [Betaproteobacteria bacterium RIFCSPLOWO2_02_FULL_65_24]